MNSKLLKYIQENNSKRKLVIKPVQPVQPVQDNQLSTVEPHHVIAQLSNLQINDNIDNKIGGSILSEIHEDYSLSNLKKGRRKKLPNNNGSFNF